MAIADGHGLPIGMTVHSASPHEVKLAEETVRSIPIKARLERVIGDRAYSSKPLCERLQNSFGLELDLPSEIELQESLARWEKATTLPQKLVDRTPFCLVE